MLHTLYCDTTWRLDHVELQLHWVHYIISVTEINLQGRHFYSHFMMMKQSLRKRKQLFQEHKTQSPARCWQYSNLDLGSSYTKIWSHGYSCYICVCVVFKIGLLKSFLFHIFSLKQDGINCILNNIPCVHIHTHKIHAYTHKTEQDRKFRWDGKHTLLNTNTCNIRYIKEKLICACVLQKNRLLPKPGEHSIPQNFHGFQVRVRWRRRKVVSAAAKIVFPASDVTAHWSLSHSHS